MSLDPMTFGEKAILAVVGLGIVAMVGYFVKEERESNKYVAKLAAEIKANQQRKQS